MFTAELAVYSAEMRKAAFTDPAFRVISWNVASLNSLIKKVCGLLHIATGIEAFSMLRKDFTALLTKFMKLATRSGQRHFL